MSEIEQMLIKLVEENADFFATEIKGLTPLEIAYLKLQELAGDYMLRRFGLEPCISGPIIHAEEAEN